MRRWVVPAVFLFCVVILSAAQAAAPATPLQGITEGWVTYANADRVDVLRAQGDTLWAGSDGGGLVGWDAANGTFVHLLYPQDKLAGNTITAIRITRDGNLWAATRGGVSRYPVSGQGENFTIKNTSRRLEQRAVVEERTPTGRDRIRLLGMNTRSAVESAFAPGYMMFGTDNTIYFYRSYDESSNEVIISPALRRTMEPGTPVYALDVGLAADDVRDVVEDRSGRVWISTVNGVSVFDDGDWTVYTTPYFPLSSNDAGAMAVDGAGRVWISHQELGQFTMYDGDWHQYSIDGTIQGLAVNPDNGSMWAATSRLCDPTVGCRGGGVWAFEGGSWRQRYNLSDGIADEEVHSITFGTDGRIWLGHELSGQNRVEVSRKSGNSWQIYNSVQEAIERDFDAILATRSASDLWTTAAGWVWTRHLGAVRGYAPGLGWKALYTGNTALNSNETRVIATDEAGGVWVGAHRMFDGQSQVGGGINYWDGNGWTHYTAENSNLGDNLVSKVSVGRSKVWVKTQTAISRFSDGAWTSYGGRDTSPVVEQDYWSIIDSKDMPSISDNRMWTVDDAERVWVWDGEGARYYRPDIGWVNFTFDNTLRKIEAKTYSQRPSSVGETSIWISAVDIPSSADAQAAYSTGYLMIGDDPTVYRYESFVAHSQEEINGIQVSPRLREPVVPNMPIYAVELGLLTNVVNDVAVGPDGRIWFATAPHRVGSTNVYGGVSVLDMDTGTWEQYSFRNTSRRGQVVGIVTEDVAAGNQDVSADFANADAAADALSSGFVMFEDDPTVYRYNGFDGGAISVKPIFSSLVGIEVGAQQPLPAGTQIFAVELGMLGTPGGDGWADRLAVDSAGHMWIVVSGVGVSVVDGEGVWTTYLPADNGLADERISGMLVRGNEVWIWTDGMGVSVFRDGSWRTYNVFNSGLADNEIESLAITVNGEAWMASHNGGISVLTLPGFRLDTGSRRALALPGGTATVHYELVPLGSFNASVTLSVDGLPPGITATFAPSTVNPGGTAELTLDVSQHVAPGRYPLTVRGQSPDGLTTTRSLTLLVVSKIYRSNLPLIAR